MARGAVSSSMSTFKPEAEPPDGDDGGDDPDGDDDISPEELDRLAEEAIDGDKFVSVEEHNRRRDD